MSQARAIVIAILFMSMMIFYAVGTTIASSRDSLRHGSSTTVILEDMEPAVSRR